MIHENPKYSEKKFVDLAVEKINTNHTELMMSGAFIKDNISEYLDSYEQPSLDGMNTWFITKLMHDAGIEIAISGIGGDELFVGEGFEGPKKLESYHKILKYIPAFVGKGMDKLFSQQKIKRISEIIECEMNSYFVSRRLFSDEQILKIMNPKLKFDRALIKKWREESFREIDDNAKKFDDEICRIQYFEEATYLLSTELRDTVQMAKANNVNIRFPLLDWRLVEYMTSLPSASKVREGTPKVHLVNAAGEYIPRECWDRRKMGFEFPFDDYIKGCLRKDIEKLFISGDENSWYNPKTLRKMWERYLKGKEYWSRIWMIFILDSYINKWGLDVLGK